MDTLAEEQRKKEEKNMAREARKKAAEEEKKRKEEKELQKLRKSQLEMLNSLRNRNPRSMQPLTRTKMMSTNTTNAHKKADLSHPQPAKQSQAPHSLVKAAATPVAFSKMVPTSTANVSETSNEARQQPVSVVKAAETPLNIAKTVVPSAIPQVEEVATEEEGGSHEPTSAASVSSSSGFTEIFIGQLPLSIPSSSNQTKTNNRDRTNYVESKLVTVSNVAAAAVQVIPVTTVTIFPVLESNNTIDVLETNNNVGLGLAASNDIHIQINTDEIDNARTAEEEFVCGSSNVTALPVQERNDINAVPETNEESNNNVELDKDDIAEAEVVSGTIVVVATTIPVQETNNISDSLEMINQVVLPEETTMNQAKESNDNDDGFEVKKKKKPAKPNNNAPSAVANNKSQAETEKPQAKQLEKSHKFSALHKFMEAESTEREGVEAECSEEESMKAESAEGESTKAKTAEEDMDAKRAEEAAEKKRERNKKKKQKRKPTTAIEETFYECESGGQSESESQYLQNIAAPKEVTHETRTRGLRSSLVRVLSLSLSGFNYFLSDS